MTKEDTTPIRTSSLRKILSVLQSLANSTAALTIRSAFLGCFKGFDDPYLDTRLSLCLLISRREKASAVEPKKRIANPASPGWIRDASSNDFGANTAEFVHIRPLNLIVHCHLTIRHHHNL